MHTWGVVELEGVTFLEVVTVTPEEASIIAMVV